MSICSNFWHLNQGACFFFYKSFYFFKSHLWIKLKKICCLWNAKRRVKWQQDSWFTKKSVVLHWHYSLSQGAQISTVSGVFFIKEAELYILTQLFLKSTMCPPIVIREMLFELSKVLLISQISYYAIFLRQQKRSFLISQILV